MSRIPHAARRSVALAASATFLAATVGTSTATVPADPAPLLLRLPDLGAGYILEQAGFFAVERHCVNLKLPTVDVDPLVKRLARLRPNGCLMSFERGWTPAHTMPGPLLVDSAAFTFSDLAGPKAALANPQAFAAAVFPAAAASWDVVTPAPRLGDEAALMRIDATIGRIHQRSSAGLVLWRSGSVLSMLRTGIRYGDATVDAALRLATVQQARIATPTPLRSRVNDDRFVLLDDPSLGAPVMWLGERTPARGRRPGLQLHSTNKDFDPSEHPQPLVRLVYGTPRLPDTAIMELWRPRNLRTHLRGRPYPYQCRRRFDATVPGARAWIRATYRREQGRCPHEEVSYMAVAFFNDVGVTIDVSSCCCSKANRYDSLAGLGRLLRALRPRRPGAVAPVSGRSSARSVSPIRAPACRTRRLPVPALPPPS